MKVSREDERPHRRQPGFHYTRNRFHQTDVKQGHEENEALKVKIFW